MEPRKTQGCKEACPSAPTSTCDDATNSSVSMQVKEDIFAVQCNISLDAGLLQPAEVESAANDSLLRIDNYGQRSQCTMVPLVSNRTAQPLSDTPTNSMLKVRVSLNSQISPGSVVWAKTGYHTGYHIWRPAEVVDKRAASESSNNERDERLILIQLCGVYEHAWVDPMRNLSQFDYHYEERSKDTLNTFQDPLDQALGRKETATSSEPSDESSGKGSMLSCSRTNDVPISERKGRRTRKPKVHFDIIPSEECAG